MIPYPWMERKSFARQTRLIAPLTGEKFKGLVASVLFLVCVPALFLAMIVGLLCRFVFQRTNGSVWRVPLFVGALGVVAWLVWGGPETSFKAIYDLAYSLGDEGTEEPSAPIRRYVMSGVSTGLVVGAIGGLVASVAYKYRTQSFLAPTKPTMTQKRRAKKNVASVAAGVHSGSGVARFGVIEKDRLAWRQNRRGMVVERPLGMLGHGIVVGTNGAGKTVTIGNLVYSLLSDDQGCLYVDFKDSLTTRNLMTAMAVKAGKRTQSFSMTDEKSSSWWDPFLDQSIAPAEKSAMLYNSLSFSEGGDAQFYATKAKTWLTFTFQVLAEVGLRPGEGTFDFLLRTCTAQGMTDVLIEAQRTNDERRKLLHDRGVEFITGEGRNLDKELGNLRTQLAGIVNAAGHRLRPVGDTPPISFQAAVRDGEMVYFGFSGTADTETLKVLGSLILRDVGIAASRRINQAQSEGSRDVFIIADEAGLLGDRGHAFDGLFRQAREARFWLWPTVQSMASLPEETRTEIMQNTSTKVVMRCSETITGGLLSSSLGNIPHKIDLVGETRTQSVLGASAVSATGDATSRIELHPFLDASGFTSMEVHTAYIWFNLSDKRNPGAAARDSAVLGKWAPPQPIKSMGDDVPQDAPLVRIIPVDSPSADEIHDALHPLLDHSVTDFFDSADEADTFRPGGVDTVGFPDVMNLDDPRTGFSGYAGPDDNGPEGARGDHRDGRGEGRGDGRGDVRGAPGEWQDPGGFAGVGGQQMTKLSAEEAAALRDKAGTRFATGQNNEAAHDTRQDGTAHGRKDRRAGDESARDTHTVGEQSARQQPRAQQPRVPAGPATAPKSGRKVAPPTAAPVSGQRAETRTKSVEGSTPGEEGVSTANQESHQAAGRESGRPDTSRSGLTSAPPATGGRDVHGDAADQRNEPAAETHRSDQGTGQVDQADNYRDGDTPASGIPLNKQESGTSAPPAAGLLWDDQAATQAMPQRGTGGHSTNPQEAAPTVTNGADDEEFE